MSRGASAGCLPPRCECDVRACLSRDAEKVDAQSTSEPDGYEFAIFEILVMMDAAATPATVGDELVVLGRTRDDADNSEWYACALWRVDRGESFMVEGRAVRSTGRTVSRSDIYDGRS